MRRSLICRRTVRIVTTLAGFISEGARNIYSRVEVPIINIYGRLHSGIYLKYFLFVKP